MDIQKHAAFLASLLALAGVLIAMLLFDSDQEWYSLRNYYLVAGRYSMPYFFLILSIGAIGLAVCFALFQPETKLHQSLKSCVVVGGIALYCLLISLAAFEFILQRNPMWTVTPQATMDPMQIVLFSLDQWKADDEIGVMGRPNVSEKLQSPFALYSLYAPSAWKNEARPVVDFHTDSLGFRNDAEIKTADIAVFGDSFTHGAFVNRDEIWSSQLAGRLKASEINLGLSAFSPQQSGLVLERYGFERSPKIVVYQLYYGNDFDDAVQFEQWKKSGKPYVRFLHDQIGEMPQLFMTWQWFRNHFLAQGKQAGGQWQPIQVQSKSQIFEMGFAPSSPLVFQEKEQILSHPGFDKTVKTIETMASECGEKSVHFLVFAVPEKMSAYMDEIVEPQSRERLLEQQNITDQFDFNQARKLIDNASSMFAQELTQRSIHFVDLTDAFRDAAKQEDELLYFPFDTHWNPNGHALAANILAEEIQKLGWIN